MVLQVGTCGRVGHRRTFNTPVGSSDPTGVFFFLPWFVVRVALLTQRRGFGAYGTGRETTADGARVAVPA